MLYKNVCLSVCNQRMMIDDDDECPCQINIPNYIFVSFKDLFFYNSDPNTN